MSEDNNTPDGGVDQNTVRELQRARADLTALRAELKTIRSERDSAITERDDAIKSRDGYKGQIEKQRGEFEAQVAAANEAATKSKADADAAMSEREASYRAGLIRANAEAAATRLGAVDAKDAVRLMDLSSVTVADDGSFVGLDEVVAAAKESKGYLFAEAAKPGSVTGNTVSSPAPKPVSGQPASVSDMSPAEYAAAKRGFLSGAARR